MFFCSQPVDKHGGQFIRRQYPTTSNNSTTGTLAEAIGMPTGMLPMLDAADPTDRAFKLATICFVLCQ